MSWMLAICLSVLSMGAECEHERLDSLDHGLIETDEGELRPMVLPWEVVASSENLDHPDAVYDAMEQMNEWFAPLEVFRGDVNDERFVALDTGESFDRYGIVLLWVGALPDPDWEEPGPGGVTSLEWNETAEILTATVVIDAEHAYDEDTFYRRLLHEFGHCLGLDHDGDSLDLNSCMTSPPPVGCEITDRDVERVRGD